MCTKACGEVFEADFWSRMLVRTQNIVENSGNLSFEYLEGLERASRFWMDEDTLLELPKNNVRDCFL